MELTNHDPDVLYIYLVVPWHLQYNFRGAILIRLNNVVVVMFPDTSFAEVA